MKKYGLPHISLKLLLAAMLLGVTLRMEAQVVNTKLKAQLENYFKTYNNPTIENSQKYGLSKVMTSESQKTVEVFANEVFGMQPFTPELVSSIYKKVNGLLPDNYKGYSLKIYAGNYEISELITAAWTNRLAEGRYWRDVEYKGTPWIKNITQPNTVTAGLQGRHLSLWASHGAYYANGDHQWKWQRPHLFCTTEDLLTQSIAVPFLYPMLERAGAIVFTPRERDWQRNEVVVDNDFPNDNGLYQENANGHSWRSTKPGFTNTHKTLTDFDDPHHEGTARYIETQDDDDNLSTALWMPNIPKDGNYAVYVTYPVLPNAVPDACYLIRHAGISTRIQVNQQMGGSTWVYLGTFDFKAGQSNENCIMLLNYSQHPGVVGADAIRLGGGMSNVLRADLKREIIDQPIDPRDTTGYVLLPGSIVKPNGHIVPPNTRLIDHVDSLFTQTDSTVQILQYTYTNNLISSGLPRHLEAARYTTQWLGLTRDQFGVKDGTYDYGDDINARPIATNYLSRGSIYLPGDSGLCVPIELNLALHSDAGYKRNNGYIGSLAIHTSNTDDGMMPGGLSRMASRDLCDILLQQVTNDLTKQYGTWTRRQIYDRNYGETRIPQIPSAILEMFSHQNYYDMLRALDPVFKFRLSRSIYKGILRYVTLQHNNTAGLSSDADKKTAGNHGNVRVDPIVAPLPVQCFSAQADPINHHIRLNWLPTIDETDSTAIPTSYIIYTRTSQHGWDNGTLVQGTHYDFHPQDSLLYHFRVEAANDGGRSMPSETLCARLTTTPGVPSILIMNGFQRVAAPQAICTADSCGFDMLRDPGVPYIHTTEFCGRQLYFSWDGIGKETSRGMGHSGTELEGKLIVGNTFDYPITHAEDFLKVGDYNISSCSRKALESEMVLAGGYELLDVIMGAQRNDGYSSLTYKTFPKALQSILRNFTEKGGALLVSGAYIGTDMQSTEEQQFTDRVLHYRTGTEVRAENNLLSIGGMNTQCSYMTTPNEERLCTAYTSSLTPDNRAFATLEYIQTHQPAAVAYHGPDYNSIAVGFPIEQIQEASVRQNIMHGFLDFLLKR